MGCPHSLQVNLCQFVPFSSSPYRQNGFIKAFGILTRQYLTFNFKAREKENKKNEHEALFEMKQLGKKNRPINCYMSHEK
jgi:hypothetical protein